MLIGMFHYRKHPEKVRRAYDYAAIAKMEGLDFFFFSSRNVDFDKKTIIGYYYENGHWFLKEFPFPDIIINHVGPKTKKQTLVYYELRKLIPFTSHSVGTKLSVYNRIKKNPEFSQYLIPFERLRKPMDVFLFIKEHQKIIIKPISGNHGDKIVLIEKEMDKYIITENNQQLSMKTIEFYNYLRDLMKNNKMIIQKYIKCKTVLGDPFDIRLHVQKNEFGEWIITIIYPKIGYSDKITTNLGQGGKIALLKIFLSKTFNAEYYNMMRYLEVFALNFAKEFESLYNHDFDELGIDVGIDENQKIWIYEVNWRPGHMFIETLAAKNAVLYAKYLGTKKGENPK